MGRTQTKRGFMTAGKGEQSEMWRPTWHTVGIGNTLWFPYTHTQWMPGKVLGSNKISVRVKPLHGTEYREIAVPWSEVRWHKPAEAIEVAS